MINTNPYDRWENTWEKFRFENKALSRLVHLMCDIKPDSKSPLLPEWESEMKEVRRLCVKNHERGIALNIRDLKDYRDKGK